MGKTFNPRLLAALAAGACLSLQAYGQTVKVRGHVQDETGEPIVFASVRVPGTKTITQTDANGNFTLSVAAGQELQISYIGYKTASVKADASLVITLEDNSTLNEAVVIGYGVARKNDLTGSVTAIKPDEKNKGLVVNAQDLIQGKIAGVNVSANSGAPGEGSTIRIRGGSSLSASNNPLIVIDGVALDDNAVKGMGNSLSMVNPADIETFTVLKDASATAIYGSRGSNGVIIITTKKGTTGSAPRVSYNGNVSFGYNPHKVDVMDADEYRSFIHSYYGENSDAASFLGPLTGKGTDWQDEVYHLAVSHDHNITLSGGLKHMPYRLSLGYTNQEGILRTSDFERYTVGVNLNPSFLDDHLKFNLSGKVMHANTRFANTGAVYAATAFDPTQPVRSDDPRYDNFGGYFTWTADGAALNDPTWPYTQQRNATKNPVALLNQTDDHGKSQSYVGNIELDYKVHGFEELRLHANLGGTYSTGQRDFWSSPYLGDDNIYYGREGYSQEDKYIAQFNAYAQWYKDFNENHHFDIMAGYEWQHFHYEGDEAYWGNYPSTNTGTAADGTALAGTRRTLSDSRWASENYLVSFFGRANYTLLGRYLFTATLRYDGSSRFKDHWALFPSFAFAWRLKDEKWLKNNDFVSELKLRLGYGQTGQQENIGDYGYLATYATNIGSDSYYPVSGNGTLYRPDAYNPDLTWETTTTYNVGLDFGIIRGKLSGSVDFYYRKTTDLIGKDVPVANGTNFKNTVTSNIGELENKGVEMSLTYKPISTKDWYWEITANATYNHNEITELNGVDMTPFGTHSTSTYVGAQAVGQPAYSFYVYQQVYDGNGKPVEGVFVDRNGDGRITSDDKYFYKSAIAPWTAGLSTRLSYKNWDLGLSFHGSFGNYVYNEVDAGFANVSKAYDNSFDYLHNVTKEALKLNWSSYDYALSDYFVQNASFFRCDNITLGYSFDHILKGRRYKGVSGRVYASVSNVFTITKYSGVDPEINTSQEGMDKNLYPRPRTFQIGLNLNF